MNKSITITTSIGVVFVVAFIFGMIPLENQAKAQTEPTSYPTREKTIT